MDDATREQLNHHNQQAMAEMAVNAAGMILSLLMDCEDNDIYLRLSNPASHRVEYACIEGSRHNLQLIAGQLGLTVTDSTIEVPHD